ncbi:MULTISPECIES: bifunctional nuclease family protein [unclassified Stygiolobus]|uniref:bifunctional nuclease family protein n=1 Tax=unclassified Stygiolobus TaxID=2824672 RepID=UPI00307EB824
MQADTDENLIRVKRVDAFFYPLHAIPTMVLYLEDSREFKMFYIPPEIVILVNKLQGKNEYEGITGNDNRESLYDILYDIVSFSTDIKENLKKIVNRVIIDDIIKESGVYVATVEFKFDGVIIEKKLIPSHAVLLALLCDKPIFVKKQLVEEQEAEEKKRGSDVE